MGCSGQKKTRKKKKKKLCGNKTMASNNKENIGGKGNAN